MPMSVIARWSDSKERKCLILFSLDKIIALAGALAVIATAVAKVSDSVLAWLKFKKEQKK